MSLEDIKKLAAGAALIAQKRGEKIDPSLIEWAREQCKTEDRTLNQLWRDISKNP